jgi:hypothetical protein
MLDPFEDRLALGPVRVGVLDVDPVLRAERRRDRSGQRQVVVEPVVD